MKLLKQNKMKNLLTHLKTSLIVLLIIGLILSITVLLYLTWEQTFKVMSIGAAIYAIYIVTRFIVEIVGGFFILIYDMVYEFLTKQKVKHELIKQQER
jgi:uncharacterized BrkB/YihY/UPF0761 family membrane protein